MLPVVWFSRYGGRRSAIEVKRGEDHVLLLRMAQPIELKRVGLAQLEEEWIPRPDYPPHRAAAKYLESESIQGAEDEVFNYLKEIIMHYVLSRAGSFLSAHKTKQEANTVFGKMPFDDRKDRIVASKPEDLVNMPLSAMAGLYNECVGPNDKVKKFGDKSAAMPRVFQALEERHGGKKPKPEKAPKSEKTKSEKAPKSEKAERTPRAESKQAKLIARLQKGPSTLEQLAEASGFDEANVRTCVGILRSKKKMGIELDGGKYRLA